MPHSYDFDRMVWHKKERSLSCVYSRESASGRKSHGFVTEEFPEGCSLTQAAERLEEMASTLRSLEGTQKIEPLGDSAGQD